MPKPRDSTIVSHLIFLILDDLRSLNREALASAQIQFLKHVRYNVIQMRTNPSLGVRAACRRSYKHRLAGVILTSASKNFIKTNLQVIGKPMTMRAVASHTHSQTWL